jgi:3-oxoacyl-[acyl-carrier-protein] synthase II
MVVSAGNAITPGARPAAAERPAAAVTAVAVYTPRTTGGATPSRMSGDPPAQHAATLLGGKGLRYKDEATTLALCAVHIALGRSDGCGRHAGPVDVRTAVVASSNLGNVSTVARVAQAAHTGAVRDVSPLDAPNASSNVVASTVAIWFRFGGPNIMICSGATSSLDAVAVGSILLGSGRADRVVVVASEPADEWAATISRGRRAGVGALWAEAACVLLEPVHSTSALARIGRVRRLPAGSALATDEGTRAVVADLTGHRRDSYGTAGLLDLVAAVRQVGSSSGARLEVRCGDETDGWRALTVSSGADS